MSLGACTKVNGGVRATCNWGDYKGELGTVHPSTDSGLPLCRFLFMLTAHLLSSFCCIQQVWLSDVWRIGTRDERDEGTWGNRQFLPFRQT